MTSSDRPALNLKRFLDGAMPSVLGAAAVGVANSLLLVALVLSLAYSFREPFDLSPVWPALTVLTLGAVTALGPPARSRATSTVRSTAQRSIYQHLLTVGPTLRDDRRTGDVAGVITDGVERVAVMVGRFFPLVVRGAVVPIVVAVIAMTIDLWAGLAMLLAFPAVPAALRGLERSFREAGERLRRSRDALAADFLDALQGYTTLKLFDRASDWAAVLEARSERVRDDTMSVLRVNQRALIWVDLVYSFVSVLCVVGVVAWRVSMGAIDAPEAVALFFLAIISIEPLADLVSFFYLGALGLGALRRIRELGDIPAMERGHSDPQVPGLGQLAFENVTFTYDGASTPALVNVELALSPGTSVALIGASGAGKSTLASLALGLRRPDSGRVTIDGVDVAEVGAPWLAHRITYVGQATHLFTDTVAANLRVARPDASDDDLVAACRQANILDAVRRLPDGFDTVIGERGRGLSGGEAQRIGIARALLADTPIVILDEATSRLDLETEALVTEALERLMADRTVLVIAHRATTARRCDLIAHLDAGRIVSVARPDEITGGLFQRMAGGTG